MGKASPNDVKNMLMVGEGGKKDFIDFLAERFRNSIAGPSVYQLVDQIPAAAAAVDTSLAAKIWSYRLYFQQEPGDDLVRRRDIVAVGEDVLLVLSADCDLLRFWAKNLGIINAVSLHELDQSNTTLKAMLALCVKPKFAAVNSLLARVGENLSDGPFVVPFVPKSGVFKNYIAIPKDLVSRRIPTPPGWVDFSKDDKKTHSMKYAYWQGAQRLCTVSEPFLTPVVQHVFNTIGGTGVPDHPDDMKEILKKILEDFNAVPPPTALAASAPATTTTAPASAVPVPQPQSPAASTGIATAAPATAAPVPEPAPPPVQEAEQNSTQAVSQLPSTDALVSTNGPKVGGEPPDPAE